MDQAASVLSLPHHALYISFYPKLRADAIPLPRTSPPTVLIIANSLKVADKLVSSKIHYNLRVVETLVAARVLAEGLDLSVGREEKVTLREVLDRWLGVEAGVEVSADKLEEGLRGILIKVEDVLGSGGDKEGLTMEEMIAASKLSKEEFHQLYLSWVDGAFPYEPFPVIPNFTDVSLFPNIVEATRFQLYKRAKHVFSEALRVLQFRRICLFTPAESVSSSVHLELGRLMDESQESCAELFDCSCPELDELTRLARQSGALGSRLTGTLYFFTSFLFDFDAQ